MKITILLMLFLLACDNDEKPINTDIFPLSVGSKWVYTVTTQVPIYAIYEQLVEIKEIDSLGYSTIHRSWYNILGTSSFIQKDDGIYQKLGTTDYLFLKYPLSDGDSYMSDETIIKLATDTTISVPAGTFSSYQYSSFQDGLIVSINFYKKGVGLIKQINYAQDGSIPFQMELKSYQVK